MKCYFCNQQCEKMTTQAATYSDECEFCDNHSMIVFHKYGYVSHAQGDCSGPNCCPQIILNTVYIYFAISDKSYTATWMINGNLFRIDQLFTLSTSGIFFLPNCNRYITPDNIIHKFKTLITFS